MVCSRVLRACRARLCGGFLTSQSLMDTPCVPEPNLPLLSLCSLLHIKNRLGKDFFLPAISGGTFPRTHINSQLSEIRIYSESLGIASP